VPTPATVEVWESNGTSGAETHTQVTAYNFGSSDTPNLTAATYPLVIPVGVGPIYAYRKFTRWKLVTWVDTNTIDTLRYYKSAGSNATGWNENYNSVAGGSAYGTPTRANTLCTSDNWPTTAGTAFSVTGTISNPTTGYINSTTYCIMNVRITNTVVAGAKGSHTMSWVYNES